LTHGEARGTVAWSIVGFRSGDLGMVGLRSAIAVTLMVAGVAATPAQAANPLEMNFWLSGPRYDGVLPPCDTRDALGRIQSRFATKESRFWNSNLQIVEFANIRETAFRPWAPNTIPRRYCSAIATTSDGVKRKLHYSIGEDTGIIGATWGVEWCVTGTDRNWAYNPGCAMARP
jgi:hypothetical protein